MEITTEPILVHSDDTQDIEVELPSKEDADVEAMDAAKAVEAAPEPEPDQAPVEPEGPVVYDGEVDLQLAPMADMDQVVELHSFLQNIENLRIIRTAGSWDRGTTISVALDHPIALGDLLSTMPNVDARPAGGNGNSTLRSRLSSFGGRSDEREKIAVTFTGTADPQEPKEGVEETETEGEDGA